MYYKYSENAIAIKEEKVMIHVYGRIINHYEKLGYEIPKVKNVKNEWVVPRGTEILVSVKDLTKGSNVKLTKICDICKKHVPNQSYNTILKHRRNGVDMCVKCGQDAAIKRSKNRQTVYEKSLEYHAIKNNKKYLIAEFSDANIKPVNQVLKGTKELYWWNCPKCTSKYDMSPNDRMRGYNCPYCHGLRVNHTNCIATTHPEIACLFKNKENAYKTTYGSDRKDYFICNRCGGEVYKLTRDVVRHGLGCDFCSDGISYPEKFMSNVLKQVGLKFKRQATFKWLNNKRYDFYIESLNCIIETHGEQHYTDKSEWSGTLKETEQNDKLKKDFAIQNGIKHYIVINCSDNNLIKSNILKSQIPSLVDLEEVDWIQCHEFALGSLVKEACNLWNSGVRSMEAIGAELGISIVTVRRYLNRGTKAGWCNYDNTELIKKRNKINGEKRKKPVAQLSMDDELIHVWKSQLDAARELGFTQQGISAAISGRINSYKGYRWLYLENYKED